MIPSPYPVLLEGDVVLVRSDGRLGRSIRALTRNPFKREAPSEVSHAGIITRPGIEGAYITEALVRPGVVEHKFYEQYARKNVAVARAINITDAERIVVAKHVQKMIGQDYTERAIFWQAVGLAKMVAPLFGDKWLFCSWLVGYGFEAIERDFGVDFRRADPDDLWDFITKTLGTIYIWVIPPTWMDRNAWEPGTVLIPSLQT